MVHLARMFQEADKSFRIITPYDAQRTRIEASLKAEGLKWEDKVFNVDSFQVSYITRLHIHDQPANHDKIQGNEDDFILVSVVRTVKVGFLANERRTNVMLSRCKTGMVVCANRKFVTQDGKARKTLVGKLAQEWENEGARWTSWTDLLAGRM